MQDDEKQKFLESVKEDIGLPKNNSADTFSYFVIGLFCAVIVLIILVLGLSRAKESKAAALDVSIEEEVTAPLKSLAKEKKTNDLVMSQLGVLSDAVSARIKYSQLMNDLSANQYKKSQWNSFTLQQDKISIQGAADSFEDAAKAVVAFRQMAAVSNVSLKAVNLNDESGKVDFTLDITYDNKSYHFLPPSVTQSSQPTSESQIDLVN